MRYILENDTLRVEIESFGAEIKSVKRKADGREYMWCGDPEYWGRTSPVLFPFVGAPKNKEYRWAGRSYPMGQHGFAREHLVCALIHRGDLCEISVPVPAAHRIYAGRK